MIKESNGKPAEAVLPTKKKREVPGGMVVGLIAVAVFLVVGLIILVLEYQKQKTAMFEMEQMLTAEKDSLERELRLMIFAYDTLMTDNDTLNARLEKEQKYIEELLARNATNVQQIRTYRAEIVTMRDIMHSYIVQIDSLNTRNQLLTAENVEIRTRMDRVSRDNVELERQREDLSAKVEVASVIFARDLVVTGMNQRRRDTDRVDRLYNLQTCFVLRENPIATAGNKMVFLRIIRPDGLIITDSPGNIFQFGEESLVFTARRAVDYENRDLEVCIFVDNTGDFVSGEYKAELYLEGSKIGSTTFLLR